MFGLVGFATAFILGHHSILTTARYTHLTGQTKHHATDRINTLMNGFTIAWGAAR